MVHFEKTITIKLETLAEQALYVEALDLAADNTPESAAELKAIREDLETWRPSLVAPAVLTVSTEHAHLLATALEVIEELTLEGLESPPSETDLGRVERSRDESRARMLEGAAGIIRRAAREILGR